MKFRRYIPDPAVTVIPIIALLFAVHYFLLRDEPAGEAIEITPVEQADLDAAHRFNDDSRLDIDSRLEQLELEDRERDRRIRSLLQQEQYKQARTLLLELAASSVLQEDQSRLGDTLLLLGEVAIHEQELGAAEIYLEEALYLTMSRNDLLGTARCYQLLGQLNIRARELARRASDTYDELWQARNALARGLYHGIGERLQVVIRQNLEIRRYGAAADAWEALASFHDHLHDAYQALQARIEAARLFAATGQVTHVRRLLDGLDRAQITDDDWRRIGREIDDLFQQHQQDVIKTSQAHDYQMLYHHYLRRGDVERAWQFRIKASESMAETGDRSMFQRQADIIAVLYNSNFAMDRARSYLDRAGAIYDKKGQSDLLQQTREMEVLIY